VSYDGFEVANHAFSRGSEIYMVSVQLLIFVGQISVIHEWKERKKLSIFGFFHFFNLTFRNFAYVQVVPVPGES